MNKKNKFLLTALLFVVLGAFIWFLVNDIKTKNTKTPTPTISASELYRLYSTNENKANAMYRNKSIVVYGRVKEISYVNRRKTILLEGNKDASGIICDLNEKQTQNLQEIQKEQVLYIQGICKGFLKDVVLLNCHIEHY